MIEKFLKELLKQGEAFREGFSWGGKFKLLQFALSYVVFQFCWAGFSVVQSYYQLAETHCHIAYWYNLLGKGLASKPFYSKWFLQEGLANAKRAYQLVSARNLNQVPSLRALVTLNTALGNLKDALSFAHDYVPLQNSPGDRGDMYVHIAEIYLLQDETALAKRALTEGNSWLSRVSAEERNKHWHIWYCKYLLMLSKYSAAIDAFDKAKRYAVSAKELAFTKGLEPRHKQACEWLQKLRSMQS